MLVTTICFLSFTMFSFLCKTEIIMLATLNSSSANAFNLVKSKVLSIDKKLLTPVKKCIRQGTEKLTYLYNLLTELGAPRFVEQGKADLIHSHLCMTRLTFPKIQYQIGP